MSDMDRATAWTDFLSGFFSSPNEHQAVGDEAVERMIDRAQAAWMAEPASPFFLPMYTSGWTYWYAICPDQEQRLWVRDLIRAHVGAWTAFDGRVVPSDSVKAMDVPVRKLIGSRGCSFRFVIPRDSEAVHQVEQSLERLTRMLAARPHRKVQLTPPLGTLIGDFWDACASGAQIRAGELLSLLEQDHRLSKANRLFLRLQYLAVFEQWEQLEKLDQLPDLLRLDRPVLASDALARLAMARLPENANVTDFVRATAKFGCLVPSVTAIRSPAGAQYYAYWSLGAGETGADVEARLLEAGWLEHARSREGLASLLMVHDESAAVPATEVDLEALRNAVAEKLFDAAIDMLAKIRPSTDLLPVLVDLLVETFHPQAIDLFQQWKEALGEPPANELLSKRLMSGAHGSDVAIARFNEAIGKAFSAPTAVERAQALEDLRAQAVSRLMRAGVLHDVMDAVRSLSQTLDHGLLGELIDLLLDLERNLFGAAGDVPGIQDLRLLAIEIWALGDQSGNRRRAARLVDVVERALDTGVSPTVYHELIENLRAAWSPFLTDADLSFGLETIEVLTARQPDADTALRAFATPILSRIGEHNTRRIDAAWLDTAVVLAPEFGLDLTGVSDRDGSGAPSGEPRLRLPDGVFVAIYSLMESAARRAALITKRRHPGIRVETLSAKVATESLRFAAESADLLVIADKAAAHAATNALKTARGSKSIVYARGKGTASLVEAIESGLASTFSALVSEAF